MTERRHQALERIRDTIVCFLAAAVSLMPGPGEGSIEEDLGNQVSAELGRYRTGSDLGLTWLDEAYHSKIVDLVRWSRSGHFFGRLSLESPFWEGRPEFGPFLLYLANGAAPRIRVNNHTGRSILYPPIEERLTRDDIETLRDDPPLDDAAQERLTASLIDEIDAGFHETSPARRRWLKRSVPGILESEQRVMLLKSTRTYRKAPTWERMALEESLRVDTRFRAFLKDTYLRISLPGEPLTDLDVSLHQDLLREVEASLPPESPYRIRLIDGVIEPSLLVPLSDIVPAAAVDLFDRPIGAEPSHGITRAMHGYMTDSHTRRVVLITLAGARRIDDKILAFIDAARTTRNTSPALKELTAAAIRFRKSEAELIKALRQLNRSTQGRYWLSRFAVPPFGSLARLWPHPAVIAGQNAAMGRWLLGGSIHAARHGRNLLRNMGVAGLGVAVALDGLGVWMDSRTDAPYHTVPRGVAGTAVTAVGGIALLRAPGPHSLYVLAITLGLEAGKRYINADIPNSADVLEVLSRYLSDAYLFARGGDPLRSAWEDLRHKHFGTVTMDDPSLTDEEIEVMTDVARLTARRKYAFSADESASEKATYQAVSAGRGPEEVGRITSAYAARYVEFILKSLMLLGAEERNLFASTVPHFGPAFNERRDEGKLSIVDDLFSEVDVFLSSAEDLLPDAPPSDMGDGVDTRQRLRSALERFIVDIEHGTGGGEPAPSIERHISEEERMLLPVLYELREAL